MGRGVEVFEKKSVLDTENKGYYIELYLYCALFN